MHIHVVPNRASHPTVLLRESFREGTKVRKRTLANLSSSSAAQIDAIRAVLAGQAVQPWPQSLEITPRARTGTCKPWRWPCNGSALPRCLAPSPRASAIWCWPWSPRASSPRTPSLPPRAGGTRRRWPKSLAWPMRTRTICTRRWTGCSSARSAIEKKLAARHLRDGGLVLYDLSSSYFEGSCCPLAKLRLQPRWQEGHAAGQLRPADRRARLSGGGVGVRGQHGRRQTFMPEVQQLREQFGIEQLVMVGDRGMISHKAIDELREMRRRGLDHRAEERLDPRAASSRGSCSWACSMSAICSSSARRTIPANGWWPAAIRTWPSCARTSAKSCSAPPRSNLEKIKRPRRRGQAQRRADKIGAARGQGGQPVQGRQALRAHHRRGDASTFAAQARRDRRRSRARWHLHHPHRRCANACMARPTACATTRRWPTWSAPSARSRPRPEGAPDPPSHWPIGCARTSSCACSPTTSSGTCAKPGAS